MTANDIADHFNYSLTEKDLLPVLQYIVSSEHYLSEDSMRTVSKMLHISPADVFGVATFYSFLDVSPVGENSIRICKSISCDLKGKHKIIDAIEKRLHIKPGETTPDKKFSLLTTNCIGWCHKSPAMLINDKVYTDLTPEKAVAAIEEWL